jgi:hypothetical protein
MMAQLFDAIAEAKQAQANTPSGSKGPVLQLANQALMKVLRQGLTV